jgi:hypothetical protein
MERREEKGIFFTNKAERGERREGGGSLRTKIHFPPLITFHYLIFMIG